MYLLARHRTTGKDPVRKAFVLLSRVRDLKATMKVFQNKLDLIEGSLRRFLVGMLDLCQGKWEETLFLDQVRAGGGAWERGRGKFLVGGNTARTMLRLLSTTSFKSSNSF